MALQIGDAAPNFTLPDTEREQVSLDSLKGRKTLLVFIPFPFTGVCTGEACDLQNNLSRLQSDGANVVVITCDTPFSNGEWAKKEGMEYPILSDYWPHGAVSSAYGVFNEDLGVANRVTFVLDAEGSITDIFSSGHILEARNLEDYATALAS